MTAVTVTGANNQILTVQLNGVTNFTVAQQFASIINQAAGAGTLTAFNVTSSSSATTGNAFRGDALSSTAASSSMAPVVPPGNTSEAVVLAASAPVSMPPGYTFLVDTLLPAHGWVVVTTLIANGLAPGGDRLVLKNPAATSIDAASWGADTSQLNPSIATQTSTIRIERAGLGADSDTAADISALFDQLVKQGKTLVVVTHDANLAQVAERVIELRDGAVISDRARELRA